jgi:hypothetical protein
MHDLLDDSPNFSLFFESDSLLRKGTNRQQRRRAAALEADLRRSAEADAELFGFSCLRGPVSVFLRIYGLEEGGNPQLPPVVKAHLDAIRGIAYADDCQVEHLTVEQAPWDHPWMADRTRMPEVERAQAAISLQVEPLDRYTDRYDRAYRSSWWRRDSTPFRRTRTARDELELINERRRAGAGGSELLRFAEEQKLRDGFFADFDRPGPLRSTLAAMHRVFGLSGLHHHLRLRSGSMMGFPLRSLEKGSSSSWERARDDILDEFAETRPGLPFLGFVALDIAVRGESVRGKDLDNLAHLLLIPIEEKLCVRRGTVLSYRVYTAQGGPEGIQVRVMDNSRILGLEIALGSADLDPSRLDRFERWAATQRQTP